MTTPPPGPGGWAAPEGPAVPVPPPGAEPPYLLPGAEPPYAPPQPPPGWAPPTWSTVQPMGGLGTAVTAVSALYTLTLWAYAGLSFPADREAQRILAAGGDPLVVFQPVDALPVLELLLLVVVWVLTSVWLGRGHRAARATEPGRVRRSAVWVWLGWWVPVVSLWFPRQIVDDVWAVAAKQPGRRPEPGTGWWWFAWLSTVSLVRLSQQVTATDSPTGYTPDLDLFVAVVATVALVLWIRVVRGLSAAHDGTEGRSFS